MMNPKMTNDPPPILKPSKSTAKKLTIYFGPIQAGTASQLSKQNVANQMLIRLNLQAKEAKAVRIVTRPVNTVLGNMVENPELASADVVVIQLDDLSPTPIIELMTAIRLGKEIHLLVPRRFSRSLRLPENIPTRVVVHQYNLTSDLVGAFRRILFEAGVVQELDLGETGE